MSVRAMREARRRLELKTQICPSLSFLPLRTLTYKKLRSVVIIKRLKTCENTSNLCIAWIFGSLDLFESYSRDPSEIRVSGIHLPDRKMGRIMSESVCEHT